MGYRVHIAELHDIKRIEENGKWGFNTKVLYSTKQEDYFNWKPFELAEWFNDYTESPGFIDSEDTEWMLTREALESIPEEGYKNPVEGYTEEEMRRFVAECIRCAKLNSDECYLEWF